MYTFNIKSKFIQCALCDLVVLMLQVNLSHGIPSKNTLVYNNWILSLYILKKLVKNHLF